MEEKWRRSAPARVSSEEMRFCAALQYAAGFHCLVEEWHCCEELKPKPKDKFIFVHGPQVYIAWDEGGAVRR